MSDRDCGDLPVSLVKARFPKLPWQQTALPWELCRERVNIFHGPAFSLPLWGKFRKIVTIHDLGFLLDRSWVVEDVRNYLTRMVRLSLKVADHVIVPSDGVMQDLLRFFPWLDASDISVIPLGSRFAGDNSNPSSKDSDNPRPYILHVGTLEPRKNIRRLIQAFELAVTQRGIPHDLVLVGTYGWNMDGWADELIFPERVIAPGFVDDSQLKIWYQNADLYVQASHHEGFGLGTLDAFCVGLPIVATRTGWIAENGDSTTVWIENSSQTEAVFDALCRGLLLGHRVKGRDSSQWSWEHSHRMHWALYQNVV